MGSSNQEKRDEDHQRNRFEEDHVSSTLIHAVLPKRRKLILAFELVRYPRKSRSRNKRTIMVPRRETVKRNI